MMLVQSVAPLDVCHPEPGREGNNWVLGSQLGNCLALPSNPGHLWFDGHVPVAQGSGDLRWWGTWYSLLLL